LIENYFGKLKENRGSHALMQNRPEFQSFHLNRSNDHSHKMNVNSP